MADIIRRMVWFGVVASLLAYGTYIVIGTTVSSSSAQTVTVIRDEISRGEHRMSGIVVVPSTCQQLSVRAEKLSESAYVLVFRTWSDPALPCPDTSAPRSFHAVVFAPATGVTFSATLDDKILPIRVEQFIAGDKRS